MKTAPILGIGIDVSKRTLDIVLRRQDAEEHIVVKNDTADIQKFAKRLQQCTCPIVCESTGRYHLLCSYLLSQAGLDVRVVNPLISHRYLTASIRKQKTDKIDANGLAQMAATASDLPDRFVLSKTDLHIRQKMGLLCAIERQLQSQKLSLQNYIECQETLGLQTSDVERQLLEITRELRHQKDLFEQEIETLAALNPNHAARRDLAATVPGVSPLLASLLSQLLRTDCVSARQWIAFVGLDISLNQSGQWKGNGKLSKRGNAYLRKRLFCAAWGAVMRYEVFRLYYDKLKSDGRKHKEALVIIARKILRILFAVLKQEKPFSFDSCVFA
jgi:transposase